MAADIIHPGHINVLTEAAKLGKVTVGLLTDRAISSYKRVPYMTFEERRCVMASLKQVHSIEVQETWDYEPNLRRLKPAFVVHGDDWRTGIQAGSRRKVIAILAEWGGTLIEVPYTRSISSTQLIGAARSGTIAPHNRLKSFRGLLAAKEMVRAVEVHSGLSGIVAETTTVEREGVTEEFDAMWLSSLTNSAIRGKPDHELFDGGSQLLTINDILEVTHKPLIVDAESGGSLEHFTRLVKQLERLGISCVVIEDKTGAKFNSLSPSGSLQEQAPVGEFCSKLRAGVDARKDSDLLIIARVESLVLGKTVEHALERSERYLATGANGILIHSRSVDGNDVLSFCRECRASNWPVLLFVVPTTYSQVSESELQSSGASVVIYANQLLRAALPAMRRAAQTILTHRRAAECDVDSLSISELLSFLDEHAC